MKTTQPHSAEEEIEQLVDLFSSAHLLKEKTRINLYLPKALVKLLDTLSHGKSRSEYIKELIVDKVQGQKASSRGKTKKIDPYGIFAEANISDEEIEEVTRSWEGHIKKLRHEA